MKPSQKIITFDRFLDANFDENWHKTINDPTCMKRRTDFVFMVANSPIM